MVKTPETGTVLVIEDETDVRNFISRVLELEGYHVLQAGDSTEGIRLIKEDGISLVLLDLRLPKGNGWALLEKIKGEPELSAIPIVILTASASLSQQERALSMGATAYLVKPISTTSLKEAVARILHGER